MTADGLEKLLERLGGDAEKYEALRLKLCRFFVWRGCTVVRADELADEALDRTAQKLADGVDVIKISAYTLQVARFVWLEFTRKNKELNFGDEMPEQSVEYDFVKEADERIVCLRKCIVEIAPDETERMTLIGYYDASAGEKIKDRRRRLAEQLGMKLNALKVKMFRLREKLEICIKDCANK